MTAFVAERGAIDRLRAALARERALFEVRREPGGADWRRVTGGEPFDWAAPLPLAGAKRFFFPAREPVLRWHETVVEEVVPDPEPFVLFGVRSCDLTAIAVQDRFFADDPWYGRRRARALLVGLNCVAACPGGFCRDLDAGPFVRNGYDLALTPLADERVVVQVGSAAGESTLDAAGLALGALDGPGRAAFAAVALSAAASFPSRPFIAHTIPRLGAVRHPVADAEWQALGQSCFACTGCTSLCPTCSCFTVVDERRGEGGERVRYWDSCLLEGFQREASGQHPAPRLGDRVRRFWSHKLADDFTAECGRPGCVGCGRCDVTCPGSIGALRVLHALGTDG